MSNYNSTLQSNNTDLQAILNTINELPNAGGSGEQVTPVISVNSTNGLITATAGAKSSTHQLAFQPAKTITPTTASQIAVSSGYYTGGNVTVAGDANLVAGNIKNGVSIFGVSGNYEGSGGGDTSVEDMFVTRTLTGYYTNDRVTSIGTSAFDECSRLTSVSFPNVTSIGTSAFDNCSSLTSVSFPVATTIGSHAFYNCKALTSVNFPKVTTIGDYAFFYCDGLTEVSFPVATTIGSRAFYTCSKLTSLNLPKVRIIGSYMFAYCFRLSLVSLSAVTNIHSDAFRQCSALTSIYITTSTRCNLYNSNAFSLTGIWSNKGSIFVPSSLVASYKKATNWAFFSARIFSAT